MKYIKLVISSRWFWLLPLALLMPFLHVAIFTLRFGFGATFNTVRDSLVFLPGGLIAGIVLILVLHRAQIYDRRAQTITGFIFGLPFAFLMSLIAPIAMPAIVGATLGAGLPLIIGTVLGYLYKK
jgi:hypothetical protein